MKARETLTYRVRLKWYSTRAAELEARLSGSIERDDLPSDVRILLRNLSGYIRELKHPERQRRHNAYEVAACVKRIMDEHPTGISKTSAVEVAEGKLHLTNRQIWEYLKEAGARTVKATVANSQQ